MAGLTYEEAIKNKTVEDKDEEDEINELIEASRRDKDSFNKSYMVSKAGSRNPVKVQHMTKD